MFGRVSAHAAVCAAAAVAVTLCIASGAPALLTRGFPVGHDTAAHLTYIYLFDAALGDGQFPVRWVEWVRPGHSQPLFSFYQPGFYYAVELVHLIVPSLLLSTRLTLLGAWWLGGAFVYLGLRSLGPWPAIAGALLFMRSPYLLLDVFVRAAFPEFLALACAPAVLWSLGATLRSGRAGHALALSAASAAMLLCHLPTVLMFAPVFVAYAVFVWIAEGRRLQPIAAAAAAGALALGLACFYVAPALLELHLTKIRELTSAYFDYRRHFVEPFQWFQLTWGYGGSEPGTRDAMSFQVGVVQWAALGGGLVTLVARRSTARRSVWLVFWLGVTTAALLMTTAASAAIWELIPPLAFVQFPWRFLTVVSLGVAGVAALSLSSIGPSSLQAGLVLCAAAGLMWQSQEQSKPSHYLPPSSMYIDSPGWRYSADAAKSAFIETGYYPAAVGKLPDGHVERWQITRGTGSSSARTVRDDGVALEVLSDGGVELTIRSHGFPGWQVTIDGSPVPWSYEPVFGFIVVDVPAGAHIVEATFGDTVIRAWSNRISLLSAVLWTGSVLALAFARLRQSTNPDPVGPSGSRSSVP